MLILKARCVLGEGIRQNLTQADKYIKLYYVANPLKQSTSINLAWRSRDIEGKLSLQRHSSLYIAFAPYISAFTTSAA